MESGLFSTCCSRHANSLQRNALTTCQHSLGISRLCSASAEHWSFIRCSSNDPMRNLWFLITSIVLPCHPPWKVMVLFTQLGKKYRWLNSWWPSGTEIHRFVAMVLWTASGRTFYLLPSLPPYQPPASIVQCDIHNYATCLKNLLRGAGSRSVCYFRPLVMTVKRNVGYWE